jgi:hypothetical protein
MRGVKAASILALAVLACLCAPTFAQVSSPPPVCFAFNDTSPPGTGSPPFPSAYASYSGALWVHFQAPTTATIERLEVWGGIGCFFCLGPTVTFDVHPTPALGIQPTAPKLGTFNGAFGGLASWYPFTSAVPIPFTAGATYAFFIRGYPLIPNSSQYPLVCVPIPYDPSGPAQLIYQFVPTAWCPFGSPFPAAGTIGVMLRFRGASCSPVPLASIVQVGTPCGAAPGVYPPAGLHSYTPPVLGTTNWPLSVVGTPGDAHLFWSGGINLAGSPLPGSTCLHYLDPASLTALASMGVEPLVTATLVSSGSGSAGATWTLPITANPFYAGFVISAQVLLVGSTGTISLGAGLFAQTSNAVQITLGY